MEGGQPWESLPHLHYAALATKILVSRCPAPCRGPPGPLGFLAQWCDPGGEDREFINGYQNRGTKGRKQEDRGPGSQSPDAPEGKTQKAVL